MAIATAPLMAPRSWIAAPAPAVSASSSFLPGLALGVDEGVLEVVPLLAARLLGINLEADFPHRHPECGLGLDEDGLIDGRVLARIDIAEALGELRSEPVDLSAIRPCRQEGERHLV